MTTPQINDYLKRLYEAHPDEWMTLEKVKQRISEYAQQKSFAVSNKTIETQHRRRLVNKKFVIKSGNKYKLNSERGTMKYEGLFNKIVEFWRNEPRILKRAEALKEAKLTKNVDTNDVTDVFALLLERGFLEISSLTRFKVNRNYNPFEDSQETAKSKKEKKEISKQKTKKVLDVFRQKQLDWMSNKQVHEAISQENISPQAPEYIRSLDVQNITTFLSKTGFITFNSEEQGKYRFNQNRKNPTYENVKKEVLLELTNHPEGLTEKEIIHNLSTFTDNILRIKSNLNTL